MTWKNEYVRIQKMSFSDVPNVPTPDWLGFVEGKENPGKSIPNGYWVEGTMVTEPQEGMSIIIDRKVRNGVKVDGAFQTSLVASITEIAQGSLRVETRNSVYILSKKFDGPALQAGEREL